MAIPVYLQQFKAAGIYRVVFDKSTVAGVDSEILRLVVGYSEQGPFNIPVYVKSVSDFKTIYGDISKKLEKRGVYFHRLALQALQAGPILALNLKKFTNETVEGATISTAFNPNYDIIDDVEIDVRDIFDTSRFWEVSAEKLNNLKAHGGNMDQYINIAAINTKETSGSYFIRKASGTSMNTYKMTLNDWYSDKLEQMPEYLEPYGNSLVSDFFAEIYVFKGKFNPSQVLASSTLKNYFEVEIDSEGNQNLKLRPYVTNAYGDSVDTLDALYNDDTSGAVGHYIGSLIPNFKDKQGRYVSLDIAFNTDEDIHNMMMAFNVDLLDEEDSGVSIDLSGRSRISSEMLTNMLYGGTVYTDLLGNTNAPVVVDKIKFTNNVANGEGIKAVAKISYAQKTNKVIGSLYIADATTDIHLCAEHGESTGSDWDDNYIKFTQLFDKDDEGKARNYTLYFKTANAMRKALPKLGLSVSEAGVFTGDIIANGDVKVESDGILRGIKAIVTSIARLDDDVKKDSDGIIKVSIQNVEVVSVTETSLNSAVYGSSVSFINLTSVNEQPVAEGDDTPASYELTCDDSSLSGVLSIGDCILGEKEDSDDKYYPCVYVQSISKNDDDTYSILFTGAPFQAIKEIPGGDVYENYIVRIDQPLNQEVGDMYPKYMEGYTYLNPKPASTSMWDKLAWQKLILSTLTDEVGLRTALLDKANIDYRYVVDTFESFVDNGLKNILSTLCKEKQSAFAILNFPSVKTFVKCPYTSFTDSNNVFRVEYVAKGMNKKKAAGVKFELPTDADGASFCAFYTPLKFSDGYVDTIVPAAGLVSNLFMEKYNSRQPYYIIAGPNYGKITASGLVGPDYTYSQDELQIIEPFGVNCMIYRPSFGTFINANQTAKQTPVSALSRVNVRELVIYIQDEIEKVLQSYQWEFNNATTRNAILDRANTICARVAANGGIQAYLNVMDESNNTPEIIDNEMAILSTHIEPGMGCGKMVQELTLYRTGQMSASISD